MPELQITIEQETNQDYDGVDETVKKATGTIDGASMTTIVSSETTTTDNDLKQEFRDQAIDQGYTWDTEI
jgi:hypothetical protein